MNGWFKAFQIFCVSVVFSVAGVSQAQVIDGGMSILIDDGGVTSWPDTYVGSNTSFNSLIITNGSTVMGSNSFVGASASASYNTVSVNDSSEWDIYGGLVIGAVDNSNNVVSVGGFSSVDDGDDLIEPAEMSYLIANSVVINGGASNGNSLVVNRLGVLRVVGDFDYSMDGFVLEDDGSLVVEGILSGLKDYETQHVALLGLFASLDLAGTNLSVGAGEGTASLDLLFGASGQVKDLTLGMDSETSGRKNRVRLLGASLLADSLAIQGFENEVFVMDTTNGVGSVLVVNDALLNHGKGGTSGIELDTNALISAGSYSQSEGAFLKLNVSTNYTTPTLNVLNTAEFEEGAELRFIANEILPFGVSTSNIVVGADTLVFGGITNTVATNRVDAILTHNSVNVSVRLSVDTNANLWAEFVRQYMSESAGFEPGSSIANVLDEIDDIAAGGGTGDVVWIAQNMSSNVLVMSTSEQQKQLNALYRYSAPSYMHGRAVHDGAALVMSRSSAFHMMLQERGPKGAMGPHSKEQGLQGWVMGYGSYGEYETDQGELNLSSQGYDQQVYGTVIGLDYSFGDLLLGVAGGYAGSVLETDTQDESDATAGYGIFYASYGTQEWFGDLVASYGAISIENEAGITFGDVSSETDATQASLYLGLGKEWRLQQNEAHQKGWRFRPQVGLRVGLYDQDAYDEVSANVVAKSVEAFERWSYLSNVGAAVVLPKAFKNVALETELRANWLHEFNDDEERVGYTLQGGTGQRHEMIMQSPDADALDAGVAVRAIWANGLQLRAAVDGQFSDNFMAATISGSLLYNF